MSVAVIILIIFAIFHFIYEMIILPNVRLGMRYKLFALRDQLINLQIEGKGNIDNDVFLVLENTISTTIGRLPYFSISMFLRTIEQHQSDSDLKDLIKRRKELIESCPNEAIKEVNKETLKIAHKAFLYNSGGWLSTIVIFIIPILVLALVFGLISDSVNVVLGRIRKKIDNITYGTKSGQDVKNLPKHFA
jgi:hypothetical protein